MFSEDKVLKALKAYIEPQERVLLAVSGGADSMALAMGTAILQQQDYLTACVCHVEHGIRGQEALEDAELVKKFCSRQHLEYYCEHVDVPAYCEQQGMSLEEGARKLRYEALYRVARQRGIKVLLTAHQKEDQAETVLLRLLRGAGTEGLGAMEPIGAYGDLKLVRPFLQLSRADLEAFCVEYKLTFAEDSTNQDLNYTRNRVRLELLPYLEQSFNPNIKSALVRLAELLREDNACLDKQVDSYFQGNSYSAKELRALPKAIRTRLYRRVYFTSGGAELSYERTEAIDKMLLANIGNKEVQLPGGQMVRLTKGRLEFLNNIK